MLIIVINHLILVIKVNYPLAIQYLLEYFLYLILHDHMTDFPPMNNNY